MYFGQLIGNYLGGQTGPQFGNFEVGSIIGVLLDISLGKINFFKDGHDLGIAFTQKQLKENTGLFPFIQA